VAHFYRDQLEKTLEESGPLTPAKRIAKWSLVLSDIIKNLDEAELAKYTVMAEKWRTEGPSKEVQRRQVLYIGEH